MKRNLLLGMFLFPAMLWGQILGSDNQGYLYGYLNTNNGVRIVNKVYTGGVSDTTEWFSTVGRSAINLYLNARDSCVILIDHVGSMLGASENLAWTSGADSLVNTNDNGFTIKKYTLTATAPFMRFRLRSSALARPYGTTTPWYTATISLEE